ncbi:MAG: HAD hydrolase family protein [Gammaproteobacteria bacterium]|nr:HAD hydrolase family protein [Gammaproteobacteria bacterium]
MTVSPDVLDKARHIRLLAVDVDGTLTDGRVYYAQDGGSLVAFNTRDGYGIKQWQQLGLHFAALSGRHSEGVLRRMQMLGVSDILLGLEDKSAPLQQLLDKHRLQPGQLCYIGDDHIDVPAMQLAGLAVAVADATGSCLAAADHQTRLGGGMGAVREVIDLLLQAQGLSMRHGVSG